MKFSDRRDRRASSICPQHVSSAPALLEMQLPALSGPKWWQFGRGAVPPAKGIIPRCFCGIHFSFTLKLVPLSSTCQRKKTKQNNLLICLNVELVCRWWLALKKMRHSLTLGWRLPHATIKGRWSIHVCLFVSKISRKSQDRFYLNAQKVIIGCRSRTDELLESTQIKVGVPAD